MLGGGLDPAEEEAVLLSSVEQMINNLSLIFILVDYQDRHFRVEKLMDDSVMRFLG